MERPYLPKSITCDWHMERREIDIFDESASYSRSASRLQKNLHVCEILFLGDLDLHKYPVPLISLLKFRPDTVCSWLFVESSAHPTRLYLLLLHGDSMRGSIDPGVPYIRGRVIGSRETAGRPIFYVIRGELSRWKQWYKGERANQIKHWLVPRE
ncbi:uncharacterized protein [Bombus flavifrons]|uniref:uncharacterized protein n=1 Tax=Bombus flavifrons TaxID=103934 RepID=UPI0037036F4F